MNDMLWRLESIIRDRKENPQADSYTSRLFVEGLPRIAQKVGEEATEVVVAALAQPHDRQISELADLLFHLLVLMAQSGISLEDVMQELEDRRH